MKIAVFAALLLAAPVSWAEAPAGRPLIVNGPVQVTSEDFEAFLLRAPEQFRGEIRASPDRVEKAVETVYTNRILAEEARKSGLDKDPRTQLRIRQIVEGYLAQLWIDNYPKTLGETDLVARAEETYRLDKARFAEPERLWATHILISLQGRTREMALARANEVAAKARAGENFAALAKNYTDDPNFAKSGGRLEEVAARDIEKPIADAAFSLAPGDIAGPVETPTGFHLVRVDKKQPSRVRPFSEVKEVLVNAERDKFATLSTERRIGELKKSPQIRVYDENIRALVVDIDRDAVNRALRQGAPVSRSR